MSTHTLQAIVSYIFIAIIAVGVAFYLLGPSESQSTPTAGQCGPLIDNFRQDFPDYIRDQRVRPGHKALAYAITSTSGCFAYGYSYNYNTREGAIERALSECASYTDKACTLWSVDGRRVHQ